MPTARFLCIHFVISLETVSSSELKWQPVTAAWWSYSSGLGYVAFTIDDKLQKLEAEYIYFNKHRAVCTHAIALIVQCHLDTTTVNIRHTTEAVQLQCNIGI